MKHDKNILAIDTALSACNVGFYDAESGSIKSKAQIMIRGQAEALMPMVEQVLKDAGKSYSDIDLIGVTRGPGAFTGLRVGLSTARALGASLDVRVIGLVTTQVLAQSYFFEHQKASAPVYTVLETKRKDFYVEGYQSDGAQMIEPCVVSAAKLDEMLESEESIIIGDGAERYLAETLHEQNRYIYDRNFNNIDPSAMIVLTQKMLVGEDLQGYQASSNTAPLYLRDADVSISKKIQRQLKQMV